MFEKKVKVPMNLSVAANEQLRAEIDSERVQVLEILRYTANRKCVHLLILPGI